MNNRQNIFDKIIERKKTEIKNQNYESDINENLKISKVELEKEEEYKLKGKTTKIPLKNQLKIIEEDGKIEIKKGKEIIVKTKLEKELIEKLEELIENNKEFEINIEDINEKQIKTEIKKIIKQDQNELNKIEEEIKKIEEELTIYKSDEEITNIEIKLENIKNRTNNIKEHYNIIGTYYSFKGYDQLNNIILINSIEDYKFYQSTSNINTLVDKCKMENKKLDNIITSANDCLKLDIKLLEVKEYTKKRDEEYLKKNNQIDLINKTYQYIQEKIEDQEEYLLKVQKDIEKINEELRLDTLYNWSNSLLSNMTKLAAQTYLLPIIQSPSNLITLILLNSTVNNISRTLNPYIKKQIVTQKIIKNYIKNIENEKISMDITESLITRNISSIEELKKEYIEKFEKHKEILRDYDEKLEIINKALYQLKQKEEQIKQMKNELKEQKQKVLKLKND